MSPQIETLTSALERQLASARRAVGEQLSTMFARPATTNRDARRRACTQFARFAMPAAVIDARGVRLANDAWKCSIGPDVPGWAKARIAVVKRTGEILPLEAVRSDDGALLGATFGTVDVDSQAVLVVCVPISSADDRWYTVSLASIFHELRVPATTIMVWARVLRESNADDQTRLQAIEAIQQSATAQLRIVGDLLDATRAASGKLRVDMRPLDLRALACAALEAARPGALAKRVTLLDDDNTSSAHTHGDAVRLRQVLDNLLCNAIKFTPSGGRIHLRVRRKRYAVVVEVEDSGCGIETSSLDKIFDPFHQMAPRDSSSEGGLGLGLSIAREIVELHHGTLEASSEGPGCGTRMKVTLPLRAEHRRSGKDRRTRSRLAHARIT